MEGGNETAGKFLQQIPLETFKIENHLDQTNTQAINGKGKTIN